MSILLMGAKQHLSDNLGQDDKLILKDNLILSSNIEQFNLA